MTQPLGSTELARKPSGHSANVIPTVSLALFIYFIALVFGGMFPIRILDPVWQLRVALSLISIGPLALVALAFQHISIDLGATQARRLRHQGFMTLALAASVGYLLLIPLQFSAAIRQHVLVQDAQQNRIAIAEKRLAALRQVVASSPDAAQMDARLRALDGPVLGPSDLVQPMPLLRGQVNAVLDKSALDIRRERQNFPPLPKLVVLPEALRNSIAALALSLGFAALGRRPGAYQSPIKEMQTAWARGRRNRSSRPRSPFEPIVDLWDRLMIMLGRFLAFMLGR